MLMAANERRLTRITQERLSAFISVHQRPILIAQLLMVACLATLMAQTAPTFKANANLVIVNVSATDKAGLPVAGLKAEDFTVLEDGKPQKVSVFEYQRISSKPEPLNQLTLDDQFQLPEAPKTTITSATPGKIQYHDKRLMVFFFDFSSMQVPDQLRAQDGALEYLKTHITKDDVVAVLFYASTIQVLSDFTDRKSTRLNSSHLGISYAVFCLKKQ